MAEPSREHIGVYPGTFDPVTNGHIDIIARAAKLVHRLVVGVAENAGKGPLFPIEERVELVQAEAEAIAARTGTVIEVRSFRGLLLDFARSVNAGVIVRGLRAVSDFDYEFQMAGHEPSARSQSRDGVPDGERAPSVHLLALCEGNCPAWRRCDAVSSRR